MSAGRHKAAPRRVLNVFQALGIVALVDFGALALIYRTWLS